MTSVQCIPTEFEAIGDLVLPAADELADCSPLTPDAHPTAPEKHNGIMSTLAFGRKFTDHMAHIRWTRRGGQDDHGVIPYGPLELTPSASAFHYCQSVFKGVRTYKCEDDSVWTFHPGYSATRLSHSTRRPAPSEVSHRDFVASLIDYVRTDIKWAPEVDGSSLYLRPFMFASEEFVGVHPADVAGYYVIGSPSGSCFKGGLSSVTTWVEREYHRADPGNTGSTKAGGDYAASLLPQIQAGAKDFSQVCFLNTYEGKYLEELGDMNMFVVVINGTIRTSKLTDIIFEDSTRSAILHMLHDEGAVMCEGKIVLSEVMNDIRSRAVTEVFACGTVAVVAPITRLVSDDFGVGIRVGDKTREIHRHMISIQWGHIEDPYGWAYRLV